MRGIKRLGGAVALAAAVAGVTAGQAAAMAGPGCTTRVALAEPGTAASCYFDAPYDYEMFTVTPVAGTVTASLRCTTSWGYTYTSSRAVTQNTTWMSYAPGGCSLTLTATSSGTTANAVATPTIPPIYDPPPPPY